MYFQAVWYQRVKVETFSELNSYQVHMVMIEKVGVSYATTVL